MKPFVLRLSALERTKPVGCLHVSNRTSNVLRRVAITSIGELCDYTEQHGLSLPRAGDASVAELVGCFTSLIASRRADGTVDWIDYARGRQHEVLPSSKQELLTPLHFVSEFGNVSRRAVQLRFGSIGSGVAQSHLFVPAGTRTSFAQTARHFGISRERVRKVAEDILNMFHSILWKEDYGGCRFRIRAELLNPLRAIPSILGLGPNAVLPAASWEAAVYKILRVGADELAPIERLLFEMVGIQRIVTRGRTRVKILLSRTAEKNSFFAAVHATHRLLTETYQDGLLPVQLHEILCKQLGSAAPSAADLLSLVAGIPEVEICDGKYCARAQSLTDPAVHYERVLKEAGKPLRSEEIARLAARKGRSGTTKPKCVANVLVADKRFVSLPQPGFWALSEWRHIETRSITDFAADLLREAAGPLHETELLALIRQRRPAAQRSVGALLSRDRRFRRTISKTWVLR